MKTIKVVGLWGVLAGLLGVSASPGFPAASSSIPVVQNVSLNERLLVVYNQSVPESLEVAEYYMQKRGIPAGNRCAINSAETNTITDWNTFDWLIKTPIRNCLNIVGRDKILYIVFSYQTPFKAGSPVRSVDQQIADIWDQYSAGRNENGRHGYFAAAQSQQNVYQPFVSLADYRQQPSSQRLYSVWRLDAANAALAKGLVDKALLAEENGLVGRGCFDLSGQIDGVSDSRYGAGEWDIHRSADLARAAGFSVVEDFNGAEFGTAPAPLRCDDAALYAGWYSLDNYNDAFSWKPGAIGLHTDSLSAADVRGGTNWSANAVIKGITVTSGAVAEPYLEGLAHSDGVFRNLFEGANVGDALLRNTEKLKWMIVNIGDPLYRPFPGGRAPFKPPNKPPVVTLTNPADGATFTAPANITVSADASDADDAVSRVDFYDGSILIGSDSTWPYSVTWSNVAAGQYVLFARATDSAGAITASAGVTVTVNPAPSPVLLTEDDSQRAIALDSASWMRDPFPLSTIYNFSRDGRTRVMLFALNLDLQTNESSSLVTAQAEDAQQRIYPLVVEYVGKVPLLDWLSQVIVLLPSEIGSTGDLQVSLTLRSINSNKALIRMKQ